MTELSKKAMFYTYWLFVASAIALVVFIPEVIGDLTTLALPDEPKDPTMWEAAVLGAKHGAVGGVFSATFALVGGSIITLVGKLVGVMDDA